MVDGVLGNGTAERVLLFVAMNADAYARELADRLEIALPTVQNTLRRLEREHVVIGTSRGRMRFFSLNPQYPEATALAGLLRRGFELLPERERARYLVRLPRR